MENNEKILEDISKELLNTFFYNKKVYAIQQYDEHNKVPCGCNVFYAKGVSPC